MKIKTSYNISVSISIKSLESSILASLNRRGQTTLTEVSNNAEWSHFTEQIVNLLSVEFSNINHERGKNETIHLIYTKCCVLKKN